jgi:glycosyltransferase involved in cell wall biosynthesis
MKQRILCSLPALPDRNTGGGVLLYEALCYLLTRGELHVCVPVPPHLTASFSTLKNDPVFAAVHWHVLAEAGSPSRLRRAARLLAPTPVEVLKFSTTANAAVLTAARGKLCPTAELLISSRAIAAYAGYRLPATTRLYMMDIDPHIVRYDGPSLKRRISAEIERPKVDRLCRKALASAGRVGAISQADVPELNRMGRRHDVLHVPPLMRPQPADRRNVDDFHVLITTNFSYSPNIQALGWFLRKCWPHVDERTRLTVTGIDGGGGLAELCRAHPRVSYAGCLPREELDRLFDKATLAVNPTRSGSGFQIKLLDALARGVPIVSTAFSNRVGPAIASSDDPMELARLVNARLISSGTPAFDYTAFYETAVRAWDAFLFE